MHRTCILFVISFCLIISTGCTEKKEKVHNPHIDSSSLKENTANKDELKIFEAVEKNNLEFLKNSLSSNKAIFTKYNSAGDSLLVLAAGRGNKDIVKMLLDAGAPINDFSGQGDTALIRAAAEDRIEVVQLLLKQNANINLRGRNSFQGATALFVASSAGASKIVEELVAGGADINLANAQGVTPLMDASYGSLRMVKLLLKLGAKTGLRDENGNTAIRIAAKEDKKQIVKMLKLARKGKKK